MILGVELGADTFVGAVVGALTAAPFFAGLFDRYRKERDEIRKDLDAAKDEKLEKQAEDLADLKARVALLESDFVDRIAGQVVAAIDRRSTR